eukprot:5617894-Pleurochrysis_carterae.AAC.1
MSASAVTTAGLKEWLAVANLPPPRCAVVLLLVSADAAVEFFTVGRASSSLLSGTLGTLLTRSAKA